MNCVVELDTGCGWQLVGFYAGESDCPAESPERSGDPWNLMRVMPPQGAEMRVFGFSLPFPVWTSFAE